MLDKSSEKDAIAQKAADNNQPLMQFILGKNPYF
jgi:hypothetical protein